MRLPQNSLFPTVSGTVWYGLVWYGMVQYGLDGMVQSGKVWIGLMPSKVAVISKFDII